MTTPVERTDTRPPPRWRFLLWGAGAVALLFGLERLVTGGARTAPISSATWMAGSLIGHDAVLAPVAVAVGALLVAALPGAPAVRRAVAVGLFVAVCLVAVGLPAILSDGAPDNPTATPRDYGAGLVIVLVLDAVLTVGVVVLLLLRRSGAGRDRPQDSSPD